MNVEPIPVVMVAFWATYKKLKKKHLRKNEIVAKTVDIEKTAIIISTRIPLKVLELWGVLLVPCLKNRISIDYENVPHQNNNNNNNNIFLNIQ